MTFHERAHSTIRRHGAMTLACTGALVAALVLGGTVAAQSVESQSVEAQSVEAQQAEAGAEQPDASRSGANQNKQGGEQPRMGLSDWFRRAAEAYAAQDHARWVRALEELHRMRPFNYDFMRQLVMGYALTGQTSQAFNMMLKMQQQGLAADWDSVDEVESLRQYPLYEHLRDLMASAAEPAGDAETAFEVGNDHPMPEALAHDPETGRVFVGTVRGGRILVRDPDTGELAVFAEPEETDGLAAVFDLLVDAERGHLWVATGGVRQYRNATTSNRGRTALLKLDLSSGELLGEYRVTPDGRAHMLGAMTQASDGTLYAADSASPLIYRLQPGAERPEAFLGNPVFVGLRGIALSEDESKLYVADYELGVFFFELDENRKGFVIGIPETLNLGGIDGLYQWDGHLVAIQNGVTPQRVLRMKLDDSGTRVAGIATIARALPAFDNPTYGTVAGDDLLFLGASHWHLVGSKGRPIDPPLPAIPVMRAPIDEAENVMLGEQMLERIKQQGVQGGEGG